MNIGRGRFQPIKRETGKRLRINHQINISPVRLVDDNDEQVGIIDVHEAIKRAKEAGQDLVEVAPQARPPVCRIMDYGKWKYQQKKKEQKARSHSKQSELKEVRVRPKIDDHDLDIKVEKAREFLGDGDKVQFTMLFKGREMAHREIGLQLMREIRDGLADISKIDSEPRMMGKRMTMVLSPERKSKPAAPKPPGTPGIAPAPGTPARAATAPPASPAPPVNAPPPAASSSPAPAPTA